MSVQPFAPTEIDVRVGQLIASLRKQQGLSQKDMAKMLGVTFQQFQKYECASNRMSVSRLHQVLQILGVSFYGMFAELGESLAYDDKTRLAIDTMVAMPKSDREIIFTLIGRLRDKSTPLLRKRVPPVNGGHVGVSHALRKLSSLYDAE